MISMRTILMIVIGIAHLLLAAALVRGLGPGADNGQSPPHSLQTNPPD
jgi:hypothetical protein